MMPEREAEHALDFGIARSDLRPEAQLEYDRLKPAWEERKAAEAQARIERYSGIASGYPADRGGTTHIWSVNRGIRMVRLRVKIGAGKVTIRNWLRTRTVNIAEIGDITMQPRAEAGHGPSWAPQIELTNGKRIWIDLKCDSEELDELRALVGLGPLGTGERDFLVSGTGQPALPASEEALPEVSGAILADWAEWAGSTQFSATRLRPGYDQEQVDAFVEAIRDTFLGRRGPPLTSDEVRVKLFSTTRLGLGYDEEEVDAFLAEAEQRLAALQRRTTDNLE